MKIPLLLTVTAGILISACNQKSQPDKEGAHPAAAQSATPKPLFSAPDSFKVGLGKVFEGYERIESALAHDDFQAAKDAFGTMHAVLHMMQSDGLDSSGKVYWDSLDGSFMHVLHPMAASENIAEMRDHLVDFTPLVVDALGKFGAQSANHAYLFHCPMARNKAGADWVQADTVLLNPFFGKSMPTCGNLVHEIKLL